VNSVAAVGAANSSVFFLFSKFTICT
jgi:hypothetical protein